MRASIDWPHCPTTTRSSITPRRSGPKMSSQGAGNGCGKEPSSRRNVAGTHAQEDSKLDSTQSTRPGSSLFNLTNRSSAIIEYLLSQRAAACHDIRLDKGCKRVVKKTSPME